MSSKSLPNRSQNGAESMNKRAWNDGGAETRFRGSAASPGTHGPIYGFGRKISKKHMKNAINKLC